jgi:putative transposase
MKLTLQTQLLPDLEAAAKFKAAIERFNEAATWLAGVAFARRLSNKFELQKLCYAELRERFGLPADMAIRCISQVCEAYRRDKDKLPMFRKHAAVPYSMGKNIGFKGPDCVSISTLQGRVIVPFIMGKYQADRFGWSKGQCDLVMRKDGKWFLLVTVDVPDETKIPATDFLGVDLGIVNIAVDSDGNVHSGEAVEKIRRKHQTSRKTRQRKGTKRTKRELKRLSGKEARFRKQENHRISKTIVANAKGTGRGIALEDLKGIRDRTPVRKRQRNRHSGWSFFQLTSFVEYKAQLVGVPVVLVDPRNTSRTCSVCGHCEKANRPTRDLFLCKHCGYSSNADFNSARNLAGLGRSNAALKVASVDPGSNPGELSGKATAL